jgi:glycerol-3-phosphate acyltransferase PlsY
LAALSIPFAAFIQKRDPGLAVWGLAVFVLIALRHHANIGRLIRGRERKFGRPEETGSS